MKTVNGLPVYEEGNKCALDEYSAKMAEVVPEKIKDSKYDDTDMKQDIKANKKSIEELQSENKTQSSKLTTLQEENTRLRRDLNNSALTVSDEGESITLDGTAEARFKQLQIGGNSWQATRSGKNLFDVDKLVNVSNKDMETGSFVLADAWGDYIMLNANVLKSFKPNTTYKIKAKVTLTKEPTNIYETSNTANLLTLYKASEVKSIPMLRCSSIYNKSSWALNETKELTDTFTTPEDLTDFGMLGYNYYGGPGINGTGTFKFENVIIVEDGQSYDEFEQYGASPNPDYPSDIRNCGDDINVLEISDTTETAFNGARYSIKKGIITLNGTTNNSGSIVLSNKNFDNGEYAARVETNGEVNYTSSNTLWFSSTGNQLNCQINSNVNTQAFTKSTDWSSVHIWIPSGTTFNDFQIKCKLQKGTKATPYSPYGMGNVNTTVQNKNLAWDGWAEDFVNRVKNTNQAKVVKRDDRNCLCYVPSVSHGDYSNKYIFKTNWKENTQYTFSFDILKEESASSTFRIEYTDGTSTVIRNVNAVNKWQKIELTSSPNKTIKYVVPNYILGNTYIDIDTFMVEEGTTATDYTPHQEQVHNMPCQKPMCKGDYFADDGEHHVWGQTIFDGSDDEAWQSYGNSGATNKRFIIAISDIKQGTNNQYPVLCNRFEQKALNLDNFVFVTQTGGLVWFGSSQLENLDVVEFKEWLATHNIILKYILAEEEILPYTEEQQKVWEQIKQATSYYEKTHIDSTDEISPIYKVEALKNANLAWAEMQAQILAGEV